MQVNAKTLQEKIATLEALKQERTISLNGEYQLDAYKMLQEHLTTSETCRHLEVRWSGDYKCCCACGKELYKYD